LSCKNKAAERTTCGNYLFELWQTNENTDKKEKGEHETLSKITPGTKRRIKRKLCAENPTIWIGKDGASQELLKEIGKQLDKKEMVKIKILKSALGEGEAKQIAMRISEETEASLVEVRGHTFMLYRHHKK
jgi:RNA-binding protein